jgi:hypothetical protein
VIHFFPIFQVGGAKCARTPRRRRRVSSFSIPKKVSSMCHGPHDIGIFFPLWAPPVSSLFLQQLASEGVCWPSSGQLCFSFPKKELEKKKKKMPTTRHDAAVIFEMKLAGGRWRQVAETQWLR